VAIPIAYSLRNLRHRKTTTLMTALGLALTVSVLLSVLALVEGLRMTFRASGDPLNILVLRSGAPAELMSSLPRFSYNALKYKPGIALSPSGEPMASLEVVTVISLENPEHPGGTTVSFRGLSPAGIQMRPSIAIHAGRWFRPGYREVVVGRSIAARYPEAHLGGQFHFGRGAWTVVGVMDAGNSSTDSEIFCDLNQLAADDAREDVLSSVLLRATDPAAKSALIRDLNQDQQLGVDALAETEYYERQTMSSAPVLFVGIFVAVIMAVGSSFAAMNTMYAAVARRSKEIGTLRVLGFSRGAILTSFLLESLLLAAFGGLIGCLLVLPLNNITSGIGSFTTFSETTFRFRVSPAIIETGIAFALVMGACGGFLPACNAARKEILDALRAI
jgi:putative ABC transport system permease protein